MSQHTPGPWELHAMDDQCVWSLRIRDGNSATIVSMKSRKPFSEADIANAHLMAAAIHSLTPRRKKPIVINGTSIEAPGLGRPEEVGAITAPSQARFFYDRRMGDIRKDVPVPTHGSSNPCASVAMPLDGLAAGKAQTSWSMP